MKKRILTINECYSDNLGDQAISVSLNSILDNLGHEFINADYTRAKASLSSNDSNDIKKPQNLIYTYIILCLNLLRVKKTFIMTKWIINNISRIKRKCREHFDEAVIGGGQLILDNETFPISFFLWCHYLKKEDKKIHVFGIGVGDGFGRLSSLLIKYALKKCDSISVRDKRSHTNLMRAFGVNAHICSDVAYNYPHDSTLFSERNGITAIVGITDFGIYNLYRNETGNSPLTINEYFSSWYELILSSNVTAINLMATTNKDLVLTKCFYDYLKNKNLQFEIKFENRLFTVTEYFNCMEQVSLVISGRMHSLILGEVAGCKIKTFEISNKLKSYEKQRLEECSLLERQRDTLDLMERILM